MALFMYLLGSDSDGSSSLPQPVLRIALHGGHAVGLANVNGDPPRLAMARQSLAQKALRSLEIAVCGRTRPYRNSCRWRDTEETTRL